MNKTQTGYCSCARSSLSVDRACFLRTGARHWTKRCSDIPERMVFSDKRSFPSRLIERRRRRKKKESKIDVVVCFRPMPRARPIVVIMQEKGKVRDLTTVDTKSRQ